MVIFAYTCQNVDYNYTVYALDKRDAEDSDWGLLDLQKIEG